MFKIPVSWSSVIVGSKVSSWAVKFCAVEGADAEGSPPRRRTTRGLTICRLVIRLQQGISIINRGGIYGNFGGNIRRLYVGGLWGPQSEGLRRLVCRPRHL